MKKLSLDLDQLAVESFDTSTPTRNSGTVHGQGFTDTTCGQFICDCPTGSGRSCQPDLCDTGDCSGFHTCDAPSCYASCPGTCGGATCDTSPGCCIQ